MRSFVGAARFTFTPCSVTAASLLSSLDVIFTGVAAYDFWHDSDMGTVIFDIIEVSPNDTYSTHRDQFRDGLRYGWPGHWAESAESAAAHFRQNAIRSFKLVSSCGMSGWVLAQDMRKLQKLFNEPSHSPSKS